MRINPFPLGPLGKPFVAETSRGAEFFRPARLQVTMGGPKERCLLRREPNFRRARILFNSSVENYVENQPRLRGKSPNLNRF
jgi:hypothetical protein